MMTAPSDYDPGAYPPFAVTVDFAVFTLRDGEAMVVLVERGSDPYRGAWALPGGFVDPDEDLPDAAIRELEEETGLVVANGLTQLGAYGAPDRDPRMRVVSVVYWAVVPDLSDPSPGSDAAGAACVPVADALADPDRLAFDHHLILSDAYQQARPELSG